MVLRSTEVREVPWVERFESSSILDEGLSRARGAIATTWERSPEHLLVRARFRVSSSKHDVLPRTDSYRAVGHETRTAAENEKIGANNVPMGYGNTAEYTSRSPEVRGRADALLEPGIDVPELSEERPVRETSRIAEVYASKEAGEVASAAPSSERLHTRCKTEPCLSGGSAAAMDAAGYLAAKSVHSHRRAAWKGSSIK